MEHDSVIRTDINEFRSRYETLKKEREHTESKIVLVRAQQLLSDIRNAGEYEIDRRQRDILAGLAADLGALIYDITGSYPPTSLGQLSRRWDWLYTLGFRIDPFFYTDGGTDPSLQEYFYSGMRNFYNFLDLDRPRTIFVFGSPGSGKSSLRNVISQLCRKKSIFPVLYHDFGPLVRKCQRAEKVQIEDHVAQILKTALRTLANLAKELDEEVVLSSPETEVSKIIRDQLWLYVSAYEEDPLRRYALKNLLKPASEVKETLPADARELLGRFCRYITELFGYRFVYILIDPNDDISPDEEFAWQVLEPLLSTYHLLELSDDKVAFKFFLSQKFQERTLQIPWIEQEQSKRVYDLEWDDNELQALLRERLRQSSEGRYNSLGELSEVGNLDDWVIQLSIGNPRMLIVICDRLFSEHVRKWSPEDSEHILITAQEVNETLKPFEERHRESALERLIAQGESERVEFKSSMRYNRKANRRDDEMDKEVARTLCAFMNTEGGTLIIGVDDEGKVLGLDDDFSTLGRKKNQDAFAQAFANVVGDLLSSGTDQYIQTRFDLYQDNKLILIIDVKKSAKPVFCLFDGVNEFYIRTINSTRKLDTKETLNYVLEHYHK